MNAARTLSLLTLVALAVGCKDNPPEPVSVENERTVTATVESIDPDSRLVALTADGQTTTVQVPPEVRNLEQVKAGDKVVVRYYEALAAKFKGKDDAKPNPVEASADIARAAPGERPGATIGRTVTATVVIDSVDKASNTVSFQGPNGMLRSLEVKDPAARKFIASLQKGDEVEVTYREAVAVSVEPTSVSPKP